MTVDSKIGRRTVGNFILNGGIFRMKEKIDINSLVDIRDVSVDPKESKEDRVASFVKQIKNPTCYRYGDYIVQCEFSSGSNRTIESCFEEYLRNR